MPVIARSRAVKVAHELIRWCANPPLGDVPQDPRRIDYIGNPQTPGLHCRGLRPSDSKPDREIKALDMFPPTIEIIHHQLHHAVLCPGFLKPLLQDQAGRTDSEYCYISVQEFVETEALVKRAAKL